MGYFPYYYYYCYHYYYNYYCYYYYCDYCYYGHYYYCNYHVLQAYYILLPTTAHYYLAPATTIVILIKTQEFLYSKSVTHESHVISLIASQQSLTCHSPSLS